MKAQYAAVANTKEKERLRAEISNQIEEFLRNGGTIEILTDNKVCRADPCQSGSEWLDQANGYAA